MAKRIGKRTLVLENRPGVVACAAVVGGKEGAGPLKKCFDEISADSYFGQDSWEKAETAMLGRCIDHCLQKADGAKPDVILGGDLLNQCVSSAFAVKDRSVPYLGLYGACSTMAEGLALAALLLDGGGASSALAFTGSHFCAAERQYRFPAGVRRAAHAQLPVDGDGGRGRPAGKRDRGPAPDPCDAGARGGRRGHGRQQHGRRHGPRGL